MQRLRGWGLLLAVTVPLLLLFCWNQLNARSAEVNLESYKTWSNTQIGMLFNPLNTYFLQHHKAAVAGDLTLPPVPAGVGVKSWGLSADSTLGIELDAKVDGHSVKLRYVPVIRNAKVMLWDCVSEASMVLVGQFCRPEILRSFADIRTQLDTNEQVLADLQSTPDASKGLPVGSVVMVPTEPADQDRCGFQCVKPQSCVSPRPLACVGDIREGNTSRQDFKPGNTEHRGSDFANQQAADAACAQSAGSGYRVALASDLRVKGTFSGGLEYWVHNDIQTHQNCWAHE